VLCGQQVPWTNNQRGALRVLRIFSISSEQRNHRNRGLKPLGEVFGCGRLRAVAPVALGG